MSNLKVDTSKALSFYREYKHEFILIQEKKEVCFNHCEELKKKLKLASSEFEVSALQENMVFWEAKVKQLDSSLDEISYYITDLEKEFWILVNNEIKKWVNSHNFDDVGAERDPFMRQEYLKHLNFLTLLAEEIDHAITNTNVDIADPVVEVAEEFLQDEAEEMLKTRKLQDFNYNIASLNKNIDDFFNPFNQFPKNVQSSIDFSNYNGDAEVIKNFFRENKDYILDFAKYFDHDLDFVILHLECLGLDIFDEMTNEEKREYLILQTNLV